jgi:hypothetical protein
MLRIPVSIASVRKASMAPSLVSRSDTSNSVNFSDIDITPLGGDLFRRSDVSILCALVPSTQEQNDQFPALLEINPIPRAVMNAQFTDTFSHRRDVAGIPLRQAAQGR